MNITNPSLPLPYPIQLSDHNNKTTCLQNGGPVAPDPLPAEDVPGLPVGLEVAQPDAPRYARLGVVVLRLHPAPPVGEQLGADGRDLVGGQVVGQVLQLFALQGALA